MTHRLASAADVTTLNAIALAAKSHWGYSPEQLEAWRSQLAVAPESLQSKPVFIAEAHGQAVGFVQVATDTSPWELDALWVLPSHIGKGIGRSLLHQARSFAAAAGQRELAIDADPNAAGFYLAHGARIVGQVHAPIAGQPHRKRPQLTIGSSAA